MPGDCGVDGVDGEADGDGVGSAPVVAHATPPATVVARTAAAVPATRQRCCMSFWYFAIAGAFRTACHAEHLALVLTGCRTQL